MADAGLDVTLTVMSLLSFSTMKVSSRHLRDWIRCGCSCTTGRVPGRPASQCRGRGAWTTTKPEEVGR